MKDKYWIIHVNQVLDGYGKSVLELALSSKKAQRSRGRGFFSTPIESHSSEMVDRLHRMLRHEYRPEEYNNKKEHIMEDDSSTQKIDRMIDVLINRTRGIEGRLSELDELPAEVVRERKLYELGMAFLDAAEHCDVPLGKVYVDEGFGVNFQHPTSKLTALHVSVVGTAVAFSDMLIDSGKCDYLLKDSRGFFAYDLAYKFGKCSDLTYELKKKTLEQAKSRGIKVELCSVLHERK